MKVAVIGSRDLFIDDLGKYLPKETTEIVSGGARGIDTCAKTFANAHNLKLTEFLPEYDKYGTIAPLLRNSEIVHYADIVLAFWDGHSKGTRFVIEKCKQQEIPIKIFFPKEQS